MGRKLLERNYSVPEIIPPICSSVNPRHRLNLLLFYWDLRSERIMPPRLLSKLSPPLFSLCSTTLAPFLLPFLYTQQRTASILANLSDTPGAYHRKIRRGRGPSSGKGKTAGRGYNGQKAKGKVPRGFNGGQTPPEVSHGLRGFDNV